jgi:AraC-like DNA-binding protein
MTSSNSLAFSNQGKWYRQVDSLQFVELLFGHLKDVCFFAKDKEGRFTMADESFLKMLKCSSTDEVIGKTDEDFFPPHIAKKYIEDDRRVLLTGEALLHEIEMVPNDDFTLAWHEANKFPIYDRTRTVIGIAGITVPLSPKHMPVNYPPKLGVILDFIGDNFGSKITIKQLADIAKMSERSLERHFSSALNTSPLRYLKQVRINAACHALSHTSKSISEITLECGFCDQSHLTSEFRKKLGMTPREYRKRHMGIV